MWRVKIVEKISSLRERHQKNSFEGKSLSEVSKFLYVN